MLFDKVVVLKPIGECRLIILAVKPAEFILI